MSKQEKLKWVLFLKCVTQWIINKMNDIQCIDDQSPYKSHHSQQTESWVAAAFRAHARPAITCLLPLDSSKKRRGLLLPCQHGAQTQRWNPTKPKSFVGLLLFLPYNFFPRLSLQLTTRFFFSSLIIFLLLEREICHINMIAMIIMLWLLLLLCCFFLSDTVL